MNSYSDKHDETLVEMTLLGNTKAYEELVVRYQHSVKGAAYKITGNIYSAEDASQDAFVSAWIKLDKLREYSKFGPWVCSIAKNCAKNIVVHYANTVADMSFDLVENFDLSTAEDSEFDEVFKAEDRAELHGKVEALSEKIREAVKLHYFENLSVAQIAEKLSLPAGTVKWRLSEGRKQLRKEYGIMEKTYNENETLVQRVMRQIEELKLWRLKDNRTGFEDEYKAVLANVNDLEDSNDKDSALASVLALGYWWLSSERTAETLAKIKALAEKSHNEDAMQDVMSAEMRLGEDGEIEKMLNVQIPYLEKHGFVKALGYEWFWLGYEYFTKKDFENGFAAMNKVLEVLTPNDVYYANALAAITAEEKRQKLLNEKKPLAYHIHATGEELRYIDGKLYFWTQPGYGNGDGDFYAVDYSSFWNCQGIDSVVYDPTMKVGEVKENGTEKYTFKADGVTVETPAGIFENCKVFVFEGDHYGLTYCETYFCPNVGIVRQKITRYNGMNEWLLASYKVSGEGIIPFAVGNKWEYSVVEPEGVKIRVENVFEIIGCDENKADFKAYAVVETLGYDENTWLGNMSAVDNFHYEGDDGKWHFKDVMPSLRKALELAETKRQKVQTEIALNVMQRIVDTDPELNPNYTEKGRWNFMNNHVVNSKDGTVHIRYDRLSFVSKDAKDVKRVGCRALMSHMLMMLDDAVNCVWSDKWVPGYVFDEDREFAGMQTHVKLVVLEDETVEVPAGKFENCRHISLDRDGMTGGWTYQGGHFDYWFAPGIGLVKFFAENDNTPVNWQLVKFDGTGESYFPAEDGLFRRYEPDVLGEGYHASLELTFDKNETGTVMFANHHGTQDRAEYEKTQTK
ncbi:MAG: RNA polymerase sigma factor [Ruminococcaceae bacterium]|nr:RNA polymerase sigma factor [Oscillospiraceae bacterium]